MVSTVLTPEHYDAVRALISPDVTAVHLSDDYLSQPPFAPEAERVIRQRLVAENISVERLSGDAHADALLAMMHQCAAALCVSVPQILRQTQLQISMEVQSLDWQEKRAVHLAQVEAKLSSIKQWVSRPVGGALSRGRARRLLPFLAVGGTS